MKLLGTSKSLSRNVDKDECSSLLEQRSHLAQAREQACIFGFRRRRSGDGRRLSISTSTALRRCLAGSPVHANDGGTALCCFEPAGWISSRRALSPIQPSISPSASSLRGPMNITLSGGTHNASLMAGLPDFCPTNRKHPCLGTLHAAPHWWHRKARVVGRAIFRSIRVVGNGGHDGSVIAFADR